MKLRVVLLGPPASGKGTQAEMLSKHFTTPATSTGAILRREKAAGSMIGQEADAYTRKGNLVADELILELVEGWLEQNDGSFIFDGFPRTVPQAETLNELLAARGTPLEHVVLLQVPDEDIRRRVTTRRTCGRCGKIVQLGNHVPSESSPCPVCGGELEKRSDDTLEALEERLKQYVSKTAPLVPYYKEQGILQVVDAARSPVETFQEVLTAMARS